MNKGGITIFYTLMLGIIIVVVGIALASPIKVFMDEQMTSMTCSSPASDLDQALCWIFDIEKPLITGGIILAGIAVVAAARIYL